jgi:hypothetical protein
LKKQRLETVDILWVWFTWKRNCQKTNLQQFSLKIITSFILNSKLGNPSYLKWCKCSDGLRGGGWFYRQHRAKGAEMETKKGAGHFKVAFFVRQGQGDRTTGR